MNSLVFITDPKVAIIIALLFARIKNATYHYPFIGISINLLGTFLHELAHYAIALFFNANPNKLSLFPIRTQDGWRLGSVEVSNPTWYNLFPVAFAPLLLLIGAYYLDIWYTQTVFIKSIYTDLGYLMAMVILVENAIPSTQDIKVALSSMLGVIVYIIGGFYFLQFMTKGG